MPTNDRNGGRNRWNEEQNREESSRFFDRDRDQRWMGREQGREDYSSKEEQQTWRGYGGSGIDRDEDYGIGRDDHFRGMSDRGARHYDRLHQTYYGDIGQGQSARSGYGYGQSGMGYGHPDEFGQGRFGQSTGYSQRNAGGFSESSHYGRGSEPPYSGMGYGQSNYGQSSFDRQRSSGQTGNRGYGVAGIGSEGPNLPHGGRLGFIDDVSHRGRGPKNFKRSDERILETVCERLTDDHHIDASNIEVRVVDGEVTLSGIVHDRRTKRLAEDVVEDLPGVRDVQNNIRVVRGDPREVTNDQLNSFLRGELSAVETYRMALDKLDKGSTARGELENCLKSHEERIQFLREQIRLHGGEPATSSGAWGVFAKAVEGGARAFGDKAAIAALEEGEDHGLRDYKDGIDKLEPELKALVRSRLLSQQEDTHSRMSTLKRRLSSS